MTLYAVTASNQLIIYILIEMVRLDTSSDGIKRMIDSNKREREREQLTLLWMIWQ